MEKYYEGIEVGKRFDEYTAQEIAVLPPIPNFVPGEDYPAHYKRPPIYWTGTRWDLFFD